MDSTKFKVGDIFGDVSSRQDSISPEQITKLNIFVAKIMWIKTKIIILIFSNLERKVILIFYPLHLLIAKKFTLLNDKDLAGWWKTL